MAQVTGSRVTGSQIRDEAGQHSTPFGCPAALSCPALRYSRSMGALLAGNCGLVLAFGAALFSTVSRESGNLWATLVLASAALLLAVIVGLTTVPYLARRVAGAGIRDAFDYDVTKVGIAYVVIVLLIGIAALNTGNNLLYIIVAAMLAAIMVSGFASALVLRDLELDVRLPEHVFAGRPCWVESFCGTRGDGFHLFR